MPQEASIFAFQGGLDTNSAALAVPPGAVISAFNYEPLAEGYGRVDGYERYDGRAAPSRASFWLLDFDTGAVPIAADDVITGATSGATARVLDDPINFTGSWDETTAAGTLLLANVAGTFQDDEIINVGGSPRATVNGAISRDTADTETLRKTYARAAVAHQREQIGKVPGEGPVRGVAVLAGDVYAWRDVVGAAYCECYLATATGWQAVGTVMRIQFENASDIPYFGDSIYGDISGAVGAVVRAVVTAGDLSAGTGEGYIDFKSVSASFGSGELFTKGDEDIGRTVGTASPLRMAAGGRVRTLTHNFYGASDLFRLYGANGTGPAFELVPGFGIVTIDTGMVPDRPQRVFEIGNHLGLTFPGGSIQFSATGEPSIFEVILGAGEIGFGTEITDVVQANESAVAIFGEQKIAVLNGTDSSNFVLDTLTEEAGADPDTALRIARTVYVDKRGLRSLDATQAFGNFKTGTLSGQFERYFRVKRDAGAVPIGAFVSKTKSHYRLIWDDNTGLTVYMGGKQPRAMPFGFDDITPYCFGGGELDDGEGIFIGATDGYVYRIDSGPSFDGTGVRGFVMTPFNNFGSPEQDSRFHKVTLELEAPAVANIGIAVQYDYGDGYQPISGERNFTASSGASSFLVEGGGGLWGTAIWDQFYWSAPVEARAEAYIEGIGRNASFIFATSGEVDEPSHILQAYIVHHSRRKMRR